MRDKVSQSDWKHFKNIRERALQRLCQRALDELTTVAVDESTTAHERYLAIFARLREYDMQVARGFDHLSRSRMLEQIAYARSLDLINDDEFAAFSDETKQCVETFARFWTD